MDTSTIDFSVFLNFRVHDAEMFGGIGSTGYVQTAAHHCTSAEQFCLEHFFKGQEIARQSMANRLRVSVDQLVPIGYKEYQHHTEEPDSSVCETESANKDLDRRIHQLAEKLDQFLSVNDPAYGYSENDEGRENSQAAIQTMAAQLRARDTHWIKLVLSGLAEEIPSFAPDVQAFLEEVAVLQKEVKFSDELEL